MWSESMDLDVIHLGDCTDPTTGMARLKDESIDIIITSPPYNVGKDYGEFNDNKDFADYLSWMNDVFIQFKRVLKDGGRLCINIGDHGRNPCFPTHAYFGVMLHKLDLICRGMIIWDKKNCLSNTAWGSWQSPSNPALRSRSEYIWVFNKGSMAHTGKDATITGKEFIEYTMETWEVTP